MIQCPFCDLWFDSTTSAIHHAFAFPDRHRISGATIKVDRYPFACWCCVGFFHIESLVEHMMNNGGFRQHAISLMLGVEHE